MNDTKTGGEDTIQAATPRQYVEMAKSAFKDEAENRKSRIAHRVVSVAASLRAAANHLESENESGIARGARHAAAEVEEFASAFEARDIRQIFDEVDSFARRRPAMFVGALAFAGFALGRFARSTAANDREPTDPIG